MIHKGWIFFLAVVVAAAVVAVPLFSSVLVRSGWDRTSRYCRRLQPLWSDLTAAVPEIVLEMPRNRLGRVEPATRLHRMIIEIRDSLLHLKRYSTDPTIDLGCTEGALPYAVTIAGAVTAKGAGDRPYANGGQPPHTVRLGIRDLTTELQQLLELAKVWPHARTIAASYRGTNPPHVDA